MHRPRKVLLSKHVYFVQICPVVAGPVTYIDRVICNVLPDFMLNIHHSYTAMISVKNMYANSLVIATF